MSELNKESGYTADEIKNELRQLDKFTAERTKASWQMASKLAKQLELAWDLSEELQCLLSEIDDQLKEAQQLKKQLLKKKGRQ
jgi:gas vesicle protein